MARDRIVIVGAGIGGLAAAVTAAARGMTVTVLEQAATPGGKLREVAVGRHRLDAGPTVLTLRSVFESLFADAGESFTERVPTRKAQVLARHTWTGEDSFDLHADVARSADAIGTLSGAAESRRFVEFAARSRRIYATLEQSFIHAARPSLVQLVRAAGLRGLPDLAAISPFTTLWRALGEHFRDPRLRQLFGRYATYCGSSPFAAPATLMLVAHVEQQGVWYVDGGLHRLARALEATAMRLGARFHYGSVVREVTVDRNRATAVLLDGGERIDADAVILNADVAAVRSGRLGRAITRSAPSHSRRDRSLSAYTWCTVARPAGFPLLHHTVFFSTDYAREFDDLLRERRAPRSPSVYVCAQDRTDTAVATADSERLFCLTNAPADGDAPPGDPEETHRCTERMLATLTRCGLSVDLTPEHTVTTPRDFERLFPGTGGALYGRASHGWQASFRRTGPRSPIPGLYFAGGSIHPGPGLPMAALSGRMAASLAMQDLAST